jgi:AraC-like DNA-binding protein
LKRKFSGVDGTAPDLDAWLRLQGSDDSPPMQRLESIADPARFVGRLRRNHLDQVTAALSEIQASQHTVRRAPEHIATMSEPGYLVICQLSGRSAFRQEAGVRAELRPGDFLITSFRQPYEWTFAGGGSSIFSLRFPEALLDVPRQVVQPAEGRTLSAREGFGRHLAPFVKAVAHDDELLAGPVGLRLARNLIDLFATGLIGVGLGDPSGRSVPLFLRVSGYIADNLADPGLDASSIARACHISVRYLQALFQEQGTTVTDWIRERRLAGARRDLADPARRDEPIAEIAARWGYPDPAYFARLFRRAYGETPREWRATAHTLRLPAQPGLAS